MDNFISLGACMVIAWAAIATVFAVLRQLKDLI